MDPVPIIVKALIDQLLKRLPNTTDRTRLRVQDELLRTLVDRNRELEGLAEQFARIDGQRNGLLAEVIRLRIRVGELEAENRRLRGE